MRGIKYINIRARREANYALESLRDCSSILDIGCSTGTYLEHFLPFRITGLDQNPISVNIARGKGYTVIHGNILDYQPSVQFDGILCSHVIEHLTPDQLHKTLIIINQALKPGGVLVIASPLMCRNFYNTPDHIRPYPPPAIKQYLCNGTPKLTFQSISRDYEVVSLKYRYERLFELHDMPNKVGWLLSQLSEFLYLIRIHKPIRDGYTMVLRKG